MGNKSVPDDEKNFGSSWPVRGIKSKGELISPLTFQLPDKQANIAAKVNLAWKTINTTRNIRAVEKLNDSMTKTLSIQKAFKLRIETISQNQNNNFSTWDALKDNYLYEVNKNHKATIVRYLEFRLNRYLLYLKEKPFKKLI